MQNIQEKNTEVSDNCSICKIYRKKYRKSQITVPYAKYTGNITKTCCGITHCHNIPGDSSSVLKALSWENIITSR